VICWDLRNQSIIFTQLLNSFINDTPYICSLIAQASLQLLERVEKALKSNDCTTKCRCLLSRECLLIIEGVLIKTLAYTIRRKKYSYLKNPQKCAKFIPVRLIQLLKPLILLIKLDDHLT
jgi:hypothetical protein